MFIIRSIPGLLKSQSHITALARPNLCTETLNSRTKLATVQKVRDTWKERFQQENVPEASTSIVNILAHVLQLPTPGEVDKHQEAVLNDSQLAKIDELCEARMARMPIQYIIREWDFRDLTLKMTPPVFIPRPETEELVELILQQIDTQQAMNFLEIGCGTGAISLSILKHVKMSSAIALDQSKLACELTMENAKLVGLADKIRIFKHKVVDKLPAELQSETFDMIVSNPPYVPSAQLLALDPEIKVYEDLRALDGGPDGLTVIKAIIQLAAQHLKPNGILWLEVDTTHPPLIANYLEDTGPQVGLKYVSSYKDLFRKERFVEIMKA